MHRLRRSRWRHSPVAARLLWQVGTTPAPEWAGRRPLQTGRWPPCAAWG